MDEQQLCAPDATRCRPVLADAVTSGRLKTDQANLFMNDRAIYADFYFVL
jgi:hypothetical protein